MKKHHQKRKRGSVVVFRPKLLVISSALALLCLLTTEYTIPNLYNISVSTSPALYIIGHVVLLTISIFAALVLLTLLLQQVCADEIKRPTAKELVRLLALLAICAAFMLALAIVTGLINALIKHYLEVVVTVLQIISFPVLINVLLTYGKNPMKPIDCVKSSLKVLRHNYSPILIFVLAVFLVSWLFVLLPDIVAVPVSFVLGVLVLYCAVDVLPRWLR